MFMDPICRAPRRYARRVAATRGRDSRSRSLSSGLRLPVGCCRGRGSRSVSSDGRKGRRHRTRSRSRSRRRSRRGSPWHGQTRRRSRRRRVGSPRHPRGAQTSLHPRRQTEGLIAAAIAVRDPVPLEELPLILEPQAPTSRQHALAFDGELYDRDAFMTYYGLQHGNYMWASCAERTNAAVSFVQAWLYYIRATGKDQTMHALLRFLRLQEWAKDFRWKSVLLIYVFRALSLRVAFLEEHAHIPWDADLDNDMDRKALNDLALLWTSRYLTTSAASRGTARSVLRVFWTDWFGHKDFALLVATKHVLDWQMTLTLLTEHLQHLGLL